MAANINMNIPGLTAVGETSKVIAEGVVNGARAFLGRICLPAAEEVGLLLRDKVHFWRTKNWVRIAQKTERLLEKAGWAGNLHAHPRLACKVLEAGSWTDDDEVQNMWAGLLASSCTEDGRDETNLLFINILSQLTGLQARVLNHVCRMREICLSSGGLIQPPEAIYVELDEMKKISGLDDVQRIDRELDHLRSLSLLSPASGFMLMWLGHEKHEPKAALAATVLALHMYVRCQGYQGSPVDFFGLGDSIPEQAGAETNPDTRDDVTLRE